jgi:hypothetical protein
MPQTDTAHCLPATPDAHFTYNYQDLRILYPTWNMTVAWSSYTYSEFIGGNSYLDVQDSSMYLKTGATT